MRILTLRRRRGAVLAGLLAAAGCAAVSGKVDEMQDDRALLLLSDDPAPRRGCSILRDPSALPAVSDLADSAALAAAVLDVARQGRITDPSTYMLFSVQLLPDGSVGRFRAIRWFVPQELNATLERAVRMQLRRTTVGAGNVRLRVEPTTGVVRIGRSERCTPIETARFGLRTPAAMENLRLQPAVMRVRVREDGTLSSWHLMRGTGNDEMDRWILSVFPQLRYEPGLVDGIPTEMEYEQTVRVQQR